MTQHRSRLGALISSKQQRKPLGWLRSAWRFCSDPHYRAYLRLRYARPDELLQPNHYTEYDRYPTLFRAIAELPDLDPRARILSFGCSTGEEVATLREYFPRATIVGCDINTAALREAQPRYAERDVSFVTPETLTSAERFDAIFCMAVLQRRAACYGDIQDCSRVFPFAVFAAQLERLDALVRPGGILIAHLTNFRVTDAPATSAYVPAGHDNGTGPALTPHDDVRQPVPAAARW